MPNISSVISEQFSSPMRLDRFVSEILFLLSRSQIKARRLKARINGKEVKVSRLVKQGDLIELQWDDLPAQELIAQDIPLDIIYEDDRCVVVNKTQGMVVHPGAGNRQGTLANALYFKRINKSSKDCSSVRPGIVHRLDKETSGIIIAAYNDEVHAFLSEQFKSRKVRKYYIAIVQGEPKEIKGKIETFIARDPRDRKRFTVSANGRNALTFYKVIKSWKNYSLLLLHPRTGRTHQLRVHLRHIGNPILGDPVYSSADSLFPEASLMLHSKKLVITLPGENEERVFTAPVPDRFITVIEKLDRMYKDG
ncbi:MAG: RluA family pseudouridine synthase [Treponema sp.]|nr:RluA family pseudouridine synthase [Treponema sp.]